MVNFITNEISTVNDGECVSLQQCNPYSQRPRLDEHLLHVGLKHVTIHLRRPGAGEDRLKTRLPAVQSLQVQADNTPAIDAKLCIYPEVSME